MTTPTTTRWRACLAPLDKPTDDGRAFTGDDWILRDGKPVALFGDDQPLQPTPVGTVDRLTVEGGRIIAYGEVTDRETAEGMFSGRLRPEAGWRVEDGAMDYRLEGTDADVQITMRGGMLGYVKASSGPSPWADADATWFAREGAS